MRIAAFFDVDGTLIDSSLGHRFFRHLFAKGEIRVPQIFGLIEYALGLGVREPSRVPLENHGYLRGLEHRRYLDLVSEFAATGIGALVRPVGMDWIEWHRSRSHRVILISGGRQELVEDFGRGLGVDLAIGTPAETANGRLTGRSATIEPVAAFKHRRLLELAATEFIALDESYFYGDSIGDVRALELVGRPRVVNPGRRLKRLAVERSWPILDAGRASIRDSAGMGARRAHN